MTVVSRKLSASTICIAALFIMLFMSSILLLSSKSSALSGAGDYFPNTSPSGQGQSYAIVQVTGSNVKNSKGNLNANTKMKARTTIANIYVPRSLEGQAVTIKVVNGCDGTIRDNDSSAGHTQFRIRNSTTGATLDTAATNNSLWCLVGSDMQMTFTATALNAGSPNYVRAYTYDNGTEYNVYQFIAHGNMIETGSDKRYLNAFGLAPITSGIKVGISGFPEGCDDFSYPISCPKKRTINGINDSWVYTSFYGPSPSSILPSYNQNVHINSSCPVVSGGISFYDLDASDASLSGQTNLEIKLLREGVALSVNTPSGPLNSIPKAGISSWGPGIPGLLSPHPGFGGNNDEYMDMPGGDPMFTALGDFATGVNYDLQINNIDSDNAIQILPSYTFCPLPESPEPVGYIDSCIVSGRSVVIYGWAYDNNGTTNAAPQVSLSATGQVNQTIDSDLDYRSADINSFLNSNNYGSKAQDNRYGFSVTFSGMTKGYSYSVSGTILNIGAGSNKSLGINTAGGPPSNGVAGSSGLPGSTIPDACLPPQAEPPTCTAVGGTYKIGVSSRLTTASASNVNTSGAMSITSARYIIVNGSGTQIASGSDVSDLNIPAKSGGTNGSKGYDGENHTINTAGQYQAKWTFDWNINGVSGTVNCDSPATVTAGSCSPNPCNPCFGASIPCIEYDTPTCGILPGVVQNVGLSFNATAPITNPNPVVLPISSVTYVISGPYIGTNRSGSGSNFGDINASTNRTYDFSDNIDRPSMIAGGANNSHTVTWTVSGPFRNESITCSSTITIVVMPPPCRPEPASVGTGMTFGPRVNINNPNTAVNMKMNEISYKINPGNYTGAVTPANRTDTPPGNKIYTASDTSIPAPGEYTTTWTVGWEVTPMSQTKTCEAYDPDGNGVPDPDTLISNQPYARFYGNDLFAGGGFGANCSAAGLFDARGFGNGSTHATYKGTASELAVFAVGQIQNVLPGSQRSRTGPEALAFANTNSSLIVPSTGGFGGGFGSVMCSPDYYSKASSAVKLVDPSPVIDISALASGSYSYSGGVKLKTGNGVADGKRVVIYINGNVQLTDSTGRFGYANAAGTWGSFSDIPSLYIIASGNVYIDNSVATMDGVYVAQPSVTSPLDSGNIYTCSRGGSDPLSDLSNRAPTKNADFILNSCKTKLTVNGAFIAQKVHLLRSPGTVNAGTAYEAAGSAGIAESFRFSPELYLIEGGGLPPRSTNAKIDSIVALPPAF